MYMQKNYDKELDFILDELIKSYEVENKGISFHTDELHVSINEQITQKLKQTFGLQDWQISVLYYTLLIDEYVKSVDPLIISIHGMVFHNKGGYVERTANKLSETRRLDTIQNDFRKYAYGLMIFTAIVALGTVISAWFFAIEIYRYYRGE